MTKIIKTYRELVSVHNDMQLLAHNYAAFGYLFQHKINEFVAQYKMQLGSVKRRQEQLIKEYVLHTEKDGKLLPLVANDNGRPQFQFESEEMKAEYEKAYASMLDTPIMIVT